MAAHKKSSEQGSSRSAPKAKAKQDVQNNRQTRATGPEVEVAQTPQAVPRKSAIPLSLASSEDPTSGFRTYLGSEAEALLQAASAETRAGFRPERGLQQPRQKSSKPQDTGATSALDTIKGQPGRKRKTHFSVRAVVWVAAGVDDCVGDKAPDCGACFKLEKQGLAVVAEEDDALQFPRDCDEAEMLEWLARDDMFGHIFAYYDQQLNPPSRNSGKGKGKVVRRKRPVIVQVKSIGQSRRLEPARDEPICGAAVEGRFPVGKSWDKRYLYFTGPIPIPDDVIESWSATREAQAESESNGEQSGDDEDGDGDGEGDDNDNDNGGDDDGGNDDNGDDDGDGDHDGDNEDLETRSDEEEELAEGDFIATRSSDPNRPSKNANSSTATRREASFSTLSHRHGQRVASGASTATST
ncbi:hypothetical protein FRC01_006252, partial [Tulasnella sp. 417]